jgi:hypothetical protein
MTSSLPTLLVLLAAATEPPVAPHPAQDCTIEIIITGPEGVRGRMEETVRALVGNDPELRWTTSESIPADAPAPAASPERGERIWIDVAHPVEVRVDLPGCSLSGARTVRTVERPERDEAGLVEREVVAQIVKAALHSLRGDPMLPSPMCTVSGPKDNIAQANVAPAADLPRRRRAGAIWIGLGAGAGWGYVPAGKLEWEQRVEVQGQTDRTGLFHLLPEVGYMWSDDFALAFQARLEFIRQEQATYLDPETGELTRVTDRFQFAGTPTSRAYAGFLRAIWYRDLSKSGSLRLSVSGDLGAGTVRFSIAPKTALETTDSGEVQLDEHKTIATTDTRPMGTALFGGSVGLLWHLTRHLAIALDGRVLSGLSAWGAVIEGQASLQAGFEVVRRPQ